MVVQVCQLTPEGLLPAFGLFEVVGPSDVDLLLTPGEYYQVQIVV